MIKVTRIVDTIGPAGNGRFGTIKVLLDVPGLKYERPAYAKKLSDTALLIELFAAVLGRELGLPIPEPVLAYSDDDNMVYFASIDASIPDLTQHIDIKNNAITQTPQNATLFAKLKNWQHIDCAISFDEWIANEDRNLGNILYDGGEGFMLIDHHLSMRTSLPPKEATNNTLLKIKLSGTLDELSCQRAKRDIHEAISKFSANLPDEIRLKFDTLIPGLDSAKVDQIVMFLKHRMAHLTHTATASIPVRQLTL